MVTDSLLIFLISAYSDYSEEEDMDTHSNYTDSDEDDIQSVPEEKYESDFFVEVDSKHDIAGLVERDVEVMDLPPLKTKPAINVVNIAIPVDPVKENPELDVHEKPDVDSRSAQQDGNVPEPCMPGHATEKTKPFSSNTPQMEQTLDTNMTVSDYAKNEDEGNNNSYGTSKLGTGDVCRGKDQKNTRSDPYLLVEVLDDIKSYGNFVKILQNLFPCVNFKLNSDISQKKDTSGKTVTVGMVHFFAPKIESDMEKVYSHLIEQHADYITVTKKGEKSNSHLINKYNQW